MKNQYFGDRRDCFKYDLIDMCAALGGDFQLTYVPVLTPNDESGDGNLTQLEDHPWRQELIAFLRECLASGRRNIAQLHELFRKLGRRYIPHKANEFITPENRRAYFCRTA